jgi:myo-inositol catabolism protein IolC
MPKPTTNNLEGLMSRIKRHTHWRDNELLETFLENIIEQFISDLRKQDEEFLLNNILQKCGEIDQDGARNIIKDYYSK